MTSTPATRPPALRYSVFISYNRHDREWASWLLRALERYRIPKALRGRDSAVGILTDRLPPVFQDREELSASADLARSVQEALSQAACLVVVCSPAAAASRWVNEEVRSFTAAGRGDRIQCLVVDGEPGTTDPALQPFPLALLDGNREPLAADARPQGDGRHAALLKLLAGILGVGYDELRQRDAARRHRQLRIIAGASAIGMLVMTGLTAFALASRAEAVRQRDFAKRQTLTAERTTDFVKSLFQVSDPSEAKGAKVTALQVLDRGGRQIRASLTTEPNVRAELAATLGEVYLNLGFFRRGSDLLRESLAWPVSDTRTKIRQRLVLADSQSRLGKYQDAITTLDGAVAMIDAEDGGILPSLLVARAEALTGAEKFPAAAADIKRATAIDERRSGKNSLDVARDLEAAGLNFDYAGQPAAARSYYQRALDIRIARQGPLHPRVSEDLSELGSLAYLTGDTKSAEAYWLRALKSDQTVLGPDHPDVAATLNNVGRVMLERRGFREALPLLQRAVAINLAERDATHDDLGFVFANLAIAQRGLGDLDAAEASFRKALAAAALHSRRNRAPIMTDLAEIRCRKRDFTDGLTLLDQAEPLMRLDYPDDPWRPAWLTSTRGLCLLLKGDRAAAAPLLAGSAPAIRARWPSRSLYGAAVAGRSRLLRAL